MSEETQREAPAAPDGDAAGVLANLPRSRPQHSSARRAAARGAPARGSTRHASVHASPTEQRADAARAADGAQAADAADRGSEAQAGAKRTSSARKTTGAASAGSRARAQGAAAGTKARRQAAASGSAKGRTRAPRQGFESEADPASGAVTPPGGAEILGAATELLADAAKSGLSRGASTLKGILGRLHLS